MKKNNLRKIFSAFAVLAVSAGVACAVPLAGCSKNSAPKTDGGSAVTVPSKTVTVDTALGTTQSRSSGKVYWVGKKGTSGITDVANTPDDPYHIETVLDISAADVAASVELNPGDTILLMPGVYTELLKSIHIRPSGAFNSYIEIRPATEADGLTPEQAAENGGKVTLDFSSMTLSDSNRGIQIYGNYIYWHDIDVCGAGDNGIFVAGKYNTIEHCDLYNNRDTGLQLGREASVMTHINQWPAYNLIKNVSSHNNYDNGPTFGENADGFGGKLSIGYGNVFDGCIAYRNCDDGWDLFAYASNGNIGTILIENCIAYENGFLEYTRAESNQHFDSSMVTVDEKSNAYDTSNGDGNGFKLGGQIMEGDVVVRNSVAYGNKLHGVTDNSNPGLIRLENVTSFDNNAYVSGETGLVDRAYTPDGASNIDLARWNYSYNSVVNSLSSESGRFSVASDHYRGSITDSVFKGYRVTGSADLATNEGRNGSKFTNPAATDIFEKLPVEGTTYNISGLGKDGQLAHTALRNPDGSVNLHGVLSLKSGADQNLIAGKTIGADLSKSSWGQYEHYYTTNILTGLDKESEALTKLQAAYNTLELACNSEAVYHPFDVVHNMHDISVSWTSSDESVAKPGTEVDNSALSGAEFITMDIFRDAATDKNVTLTATLSIGEQKLTKDFEITVKQGVSKIGAVSVVTADGTILGDGQSTSTIVDRFDVYKEPAVQVRDALYPDHVKYLKPDQYTVEKTYYYQTDAAMEPVKVKGFTPSNAGIFDITVKATLKSDTNATSTMTYRIYVASAFAKADFNGDSKVTVYQDGFIISGIPGSATGNLYAVASAQPLTFAAPSDILNAEGLQVFPYRATSLNVKFNMANKAGYHIYYAMANANGDVTSEIYETEIGTVDISSVADFKKMAQGVALNGEIPERTIYLLTDDIDLSGESGWAASGSFKGLLNGQGHYIKNLTVNRAKATEASIFYNVAGGTIMNVKFKDISITNSANNTGIVGQCFGGYFHNIVLENVDVTGVQRSGGLIGMLRESSLPTYISQVYVDGQSTIKNVGAATKTTRAAGLIGAFYYEKDSAAGGTFDVRISDCLVSAVIDTNDSDGAAGFIGEIDTNGRINDASECYVEFSNCIFNGSSYGGSHRNGGFVGYFKNSCIVKAIGCLAIGEIRYDDSSAGISNGVMTVSKKNISGMFGGFVASAKVTAVNCATLFEEYESTIKESITVYTKADLAKDGLIILGSNLMNFDTATKWTVVYDQADGSKLAEPFLTLNFLEA